MSAAEALTHPYFLEEGSPEKKIMSTNIQLSDK